MKKPIVTIASDIADLKPLDKATCVDEDTDLLTVVKKMVNDHLKRVIVTNPSGELVSVLSVKKKTKF